MFTHGFANTLRKRISCIILFEDEPIDIFTNTQSWPYICSFLHYLHHMMLVNVELDINWYKKIKF